MTVFDDSNENSIVKKGIAIGLAIGLGIVGVSAGAYADLHSEHVNDILDVPHDMAYHVGLSKYREDVGSRDITENAEVISKEFQPAYTYIMPIVHSMCSSNSCYSYVTYIPIFVPAKYDITFAGDIASFTLNDQKLFESFKEGEKTNLSFKEKYQDVYDFFPPNFSSKKFVGKTISERDFLSVESV